MIRQRHTTQAGVGMMEILVSLFVLSVGLLGVASLQFTGTFNNVQSVSRSQGELVARYVAEQLVAVAEPSTTDDGWEIDDAFLNSNIYNFQNVTYNANSDNYQCLCLTLPAGIPNCRGAQCSVNDLASFTGWEASCQAVRSNPNMWLNVTCNDRDAGDAKLCSSGSLISIAVSWPVKSSTGNSVQADSRCAITGSTNRACVIKEITL